MTHAVRYAVVVLLVAAMSSVAGAQQERPGDEWLDQPVDDATFEGFSGRFTYDRESLLDVETLERHDEDGVVREHLSFQGTPGERVFAYYFEATPASSAPPGLFSCTEAVQKGRTGRPEWRLGSPGMASPSWRST